MRTRAIVTVVFFCLCLVSLAEAAPKNRLQAAPLTPEQYRDLLQQGPDSIYRLFDGKIMTGVSPDRKCVDVDTEQAHHAADSADSLRAAWSKHEVPDALKASHDEVLTWLGSATTILRKAPRCLEMGSFSLIEFLDMIGKYDKARANASSALLTLGATLPPLPQK